MSGPSLASTKIGSPTFDTWGLKSIHWACLSMIASFSMIASNAMRKIF